MVRSLLLSCAALVISFAPYSAQAHEYYRSHYDHPRVIYVDNDEHDNRGRGRGHGYGHERHHDDYDEYSRDDRDEREHSVIVMQREPSLGVRFRSDDLNIIMNWFQYQPRAHTMVMDRLPPGIERQIRRRGHVPPGLEMRALPYELSRHLRPAPRGYDRVLIGNDAVLINLTTGAIADIIRNVL